MENDTPETEEPKKERHTCTPEKAEWHKYGRKWVCACGKVYLSTKTGEVPHTPRVRMSKKERLRLRREA